MAIIFTTFIALVLMGGVGENGVGTLASATVAFLLAVFTLVCICSLVLRRDHVQEQHYTAPTAVLAIGVVVNVALLLYVLISDLMDLIRGEIGVLESTSVVCAVMLAIGLVLYIVNSLASSRLDAAIED